MDLRQSLSDKQATHVLSASVREALEHRHRMEDLHEARRRFLRDGSISNLVRPVVSAAWRRCLEYNVHPQRLPRQTKDPERLQRAREENRVLIECAEPLLDYINQTLGDAAHRCYVTNADGVILCLRADANADLDELRRHNVFEGASRLEQDVGCTAAGTALAARRPVLLLGPEHLQSVFTDWTCVGIPIRSGSGEVVGALSLAVPNEDVNIYTWGWMLSIAREIESNLRETGSSDEIDHSLEDVQNPLNAVRGVLELLASEVDLSPTHAAFLESAQEAAARAEARLRRTVARLKQSQDRLEKVGRNRETFLATLAHEMAGPLSALKMTIGLLESKRSDPEAVGRLHSRMERLAGRLLRLLDDLRDVSSINQGKLTLQKEPLRLSKILNQAVETVEPMIEKRSHALYVDIRDKPLVVEADPDRLVQVVSNLLTNAAKYTEPEGEIWLSAERVGDNIRIAVRDTGIGIAPDMAPHIFDLFAQDETKKEGGLGIGLNLVQHLIEMHGGRVNVHSDGPGQGSEFIVELPALLDEALQSEVVQ